MHALQRVSVYATHMSPTMLLLFAAGDASVSNRAGGANAAAGLPVACRQSNTGVTSYSVMSIQD